MKLLSDARNMVHASCPGSRSVKLYELCKLQHIKHMKGKHRTRSSMYFPWWV